MTTSLALAALFGLALAQQTTLTLPFFGYDGNGFDASIVSAQSDATVLKLACPSSSLDCGLFPYQTLTYGPSTYKMDMSGGDGGEFTMTQDCVLASKSAVCQESASGSEANFPGSSATTYTDTEVGSARVTVTAGASKLAAAAKATSGGSASPSASASAGSQAKGSAVTPTSTPNASAAAASASPTTNAAAHPVAMKGGLLAAAGVLGGLLL